LRFWSSRRLGGPCAAGPPKLPCTTANWFADDWWTPADGVILLWSHIELPEPAGVALTDKPGTPTTIDHRSAKEWTGPASPGCPAGAFTETDAWVNEVAHSTSGDRFDLTACFGVTATSEDRSAVRRMLRSLHVRG
jgi:hypothetical protein